MEVKNISSEIKVAKKENKNDGKKWKTKKFFEDPAVFEKNQGVKNMKPRWESLFINQLKKLKFSLYSFINYQK